MSFPAQSPLPFVPFFAPTVSLPEAPAKPVSWLKVGAPSLDAGIAAPTHDTESGVGPARPTQTPEWARRVPAPNAEARLHPFPNVEVIAADALRMPDGPEPAHIAAHRASVEAERQEILAVAREEARKIEEEARHAGFHGGFDQGSRDGRAAAEAEVRALADSERAALRRDVETFLLQIEAERSRLWSQIEPEMIELTLALANKIIKREVEVCRDVAIAVAQNALRRVADNGALRLRVNAKDLEAIRSGREELISVVDGLRHLEIIEDRRIGPGGCIVETAAGNIDARIETQWAETVKTMEHAVQHREVSE